MLSLYRKFAMDAASIKRPRKMHFAGCELYPNERRELVCITDQSEFVVADDVYYTMPMTMLFGTRVAKTYPEEWILYTVLT